MTFNPNDYLINLKGKQYLQVAHRLMWFRDVHPNGSVVTELINLTPIVFKATILNSEGAVIGSGHGSATPKPNAVWAGREIEKAETAAIGRALGVAGFGTQYAEDFEDDDHLSDSPVAPAKKPATAPKQAEPASTGANTPEPQKTAFSAPSNGNWWQNKEDIAYVKNAIGTTPGQAAARLQRAFADYTTPDDFIDAYRNATAVVNHDATPAATPSHIDDPLRGDMLEMTHVEPKQGRGRTAVNQWLGHAMHGTNLIRILLFGEDRRQLKAAGYNTDLWDEPNGQRYGGGDILVTTEVDTVGRKLTGVWHKEQDKLIAVERAR